MSDKERIRFCLKFLENPVFRVGFEFTPEYRAPRVIPITATTPLSTTVIGAMFTALLMNRDKQGEIIMRSAEELGSDIKIRIDDRGLIEEVSFPIYDRLQKIIFGTEDAMMDLYGPYWISPEGEIYFPTTIHSMNDALIKLEKGKIEKDVVYIPKRYSIVGIALDSATKTVKTGYTYTLDKLPFKNWRLCMELTIRSDDEKNILYQIEGKVVRVGTKGAFAKVEIKRAILKDFTAKPKISEWIVISPAIVTKNIRIGVKSAKIQTVSLGYSLLKQKKRPSLPVLATGSIITREATNVSHKYGFGSLYPLT